MDLKELRKIGTIASHRSNVRVTELEKAAILRLRSEGKTFDEIGDITGINADTCSKHWRKANDKNV